MEPLLVANRSATVEVFGADGRPASGVGVSLDASRAVTDGSGSASVIPGPTGRRTLIVEGPAGHGARSVVVVDQSDLNRSRLRFVDLRGPSDLEPSEWVGRLTLENVGGVRYTGTIPFFVDNRSVGTPEVRIEPGDRPTVAVSLNLSVGAHRLGPPGLQIAVRVHERSAGAPGPDLPGHTLTIEELLAKRREMAAHRTHVPAGQTALSLFLGDTFQNLDAAFTLVTIASILHAGLITLVAVRRELEERAPILGLYSALGASRDHLRLIVLREYGLVGLVAALVGTAAGLLLAYAAATLGFALAFGHALVPRIAFGFAARVAGTSLVLTLVVAVVQADAFRARTVRNLLLSGPDRRHRPPLARLLEERG
jgi:hypothetical protein